MNIEILTATDIKGNEVEHVIIDNGDGSFTSMLKSTWDEQQKAAELSGTL